ncbi:MAG: general secretion pathway protein GspL [Comamonadaceae bacterium]|nr:MAG: general secretion pathway protein GspL [Comamonadaceae bacterium]
MALLLVCPPPPSGAATGEHVWIRAQADGITVRDHGRSAPALLPAGHEIAVGVPASALSWHRVTLPQGSLGNAARLRAVLDGLLEDRLLDEPESLHFALEPGARTGEPVWVAACQRIWLRSVVQALEASGRRVTRIVPEFTPRPTDSPARLYLTGEPATAQLTRCDAEGVATLPAAAAPMLLTGVPLDTAVLGAEPAVAELAERTLGQSVPIVTTAERWLAAARSPWDLAQFDLAVTGRARAGKKLASSWQTLRHARAWRAARWGAVLLLLVQLGGLNAWAWRERLAIDAKQQAVKAILTSTFPAVQLVLDAPLQMAREVTALQQATGQVAASGFEPMLGALAERLPAGRIPTTIDYVGGQLRLRGLGLAATELQPLAQTLGARGYTVRTEGDLLLVQAEPVR